MPQAVIFDLDGTIVDTERDGGLWWHSFDRVFQPYGITDIHGPAYNGKRVIDNVQMIRERERIPASVDDLMTSMHAVVHQLIPQEVRLFPGIPMVLKQLRDAGTRCALTTSSTVEYVDAVLAHVGLTEAFDPIVTGETVREGKPAPDIYLKTLEQLGLAADECVVIEDARSGYLAARAATIPTIMVPTNPGTSPSEFPDAFAVVKRVEDILPLLPRLPRHGTH